MDSLLGPLFPLFERERAAARPLALGVLLHTAGSTYRRPGALLLIGGDGEYAGLISGGCLEGDLAQHAREVIDSGRTRIVTYDLRHPDDLVWGLGAGCEGLMRILLTRVGPHEDWEPLAHLAASHTAHTPTAVGIIAESHDARVPLGTLIVPAGPTTRWPTGLPSAALAAFREARLEQALATAARSASPRWVEIPATGSLFLLPLSLPPRVLVLGAGPDAVPLVELAARLYWKVTLVDHRPAYAASARFPSAERVMLARPESLAEVLELSQYSAAVVMSHHLPTDLQYLRVLEHSPLPYVGLLGPPARRDKLLAELGERAVPLRPRLHAPVGLDLGVRSPEAIALSIVAEMLAFLHKH